MLSICIPKYNFDVNDLVEALNRQIATIQSEVEIVILDDASTDSISLNLNSKNVKYVRLEKNIGRSAIRNKLATLTQYENLLFLDCDSMPYSDDFLLKYLSNIPKYDVICGGTHYELNTTKLRNVFGLKREVQQTEEHFFSNNFLIRKSIFEKVKFDESIVGYGHEDTVFGMEILENGCKIEKIQNPVTHISEESNIEYLNKVEQSLRTLLGIYKSNEKIVGKSKVLKISKMLQKKWMSKPFVFTIKPFVPFIKKNLQGSRPKLIFLDLYKLYYLSLIL